MAFNNENQIIAGTTLLFDNRNLGTGNKYFLIQLLMDCA